METTKRIDPRMALHCICRIMKEDAYVHGERDKNGHTFSAKVKIEHSLAGQKSVFYIEVFDNFEWEISCDGSLREAEARGIVTSFMLLAKQCPQSTLDNLYEELFRDKS